MMCGVDIVIRFYLELRMYACPWQMERGKKLDPAGEEDAKAIRRKKEEEKMAENMEAIMGRSLYPAHTGAMASKC